MALSAEQPWNNGNHCADSENQNKSREACFYCSCLMYCTFMALYLYKVHCERELQGEAELLGVRGLQPHHGSRHRISLQG